VKNGNESDVDCGGGCAPCAVGKRCGAASDCASNACAAGTCAPAPPALAFAPMMVFPTGKGPIHLAALDLDGDGKIDLVTLDELSTDVGVLIGRGDATF